MRTMCVATMGYSPAIKKKKKRILVLCSSIGETGKHDEGNELDTMIPQVSNSEKLTIEVETRGNSGYQTLGQQGEMNKRR